MTLRRAGRTRTRLAKLLEAAFAKVGMAVRVDPEDLHPAKGYWRTDSRADVYRWEGWASSGRDSWESVVSWHTMTELLRGVELIRDRALGTFEAFPLDETEAATKK